MTDSGDGRASGGPIGSDREPTALSVLVFTSHRPEEVVEPLRETDLDATVVSVDGGGSLPSRAVTTVRRTRRRSRRTTPTRSCSTATRRWAR
ncbi:hypothetical protein [Halorubrum saccharovorum]|uniref:hypothetical protein n=1 Tax=Halorubrum saccharovorum TaxID=2248 RepID=UPI00373AED96